VNAFRANAGPAIAAWLLMLATACTATSAAASGESLDSAAQQRLADAEQLYRREGPEAALPVFQGLAQAFHSSGDRSSEAIAVGYVGEIYWRLGDYPQAGDYLEQALTMKRATGDRLQESKTLNVLGLLHWDLGEFEQAQAYFREGGKIAEDTGDKQLQGAILNNLSLVHDELGDYYVSLEQYQRVLDLYQGADFPRGEGDTLGNIGGVYLLLGRFREALDHYQRALAISEQLQSTISMSQAIWAWGRSTPRWRTWSRPLPWPGRPACSRTRPSGCAAGAMPRCSGAAMTWAWKTTTRLWPFTRLWRAKPSASRPCTTWAGCTCC